MRTIAELSHGIVDDFREKQNSKLQRTFVGAEAATKAKYNKGKITQTCKNNFCNVHFIMLFH